MYLIMINDDKSFKKSPSYQNIFKRVQRDKINFEQKFGKTDMFIVIDCQDLQNTGLHHPFCN